MTSTQSKGGLARAKQQRMEAIASYNINPNYCKFCNKKIEIKENQKVAEIRRKQFCDRSCAAKFNNRQRTKVEKKIILVEKTKNKPLCDVTKGELFNKRSNYQSARSTIQKHARIIYTSNNQKQHCANCGYNLHIEVAHIKSVSSFDDNSLISEINNINNLIGLCPNCHWEYDHGLLKLE